MKLDRIRSAKAPIYSSYGTDELSNLCNLHVLAVTSSFVLRTIL